MSRIAAVEAHLNGQDIAYTNHLRTQVQDGQLDADRFFQPRSEGGGEFALPQPPHYMDVAQSEGALALQRLVQQPEL